MSTEGFDRLRRRAPVAKRSRPAVGKRPPDPQGRRSLYSVAEQPPPAGAITVACSRCGETSVATPRQVVGLALPSLHLPILRREHPSWMRCPACGRRTWVKLVLTL